MKTYIEAREDATTAAYEIIYEQGWGGWSADLGDACMDHANSLVPSCGHDCLALLVAINAHESCEGYEIPSPVSVSDLDSLGAAAELVLWEVLRAMILETVNELIEGLENLDSFLEVASDTEEWLDDRVDAQNCGIAAVQNMRDDAEEWRCLGLIESILDEFEQALDDALEDD